MKVLVLTTSYPRVGGLCRDLPDGWVRQVRAFVDQFPKVLDELDELLTGNQIWLKRTQKVGIISRADAIALGVTGPNLRGSGVAYDVRKTEPYLGYENYEEARRHARADKQTGSRLFLATATDSGGEQSLSSHVAQGVANIEATFLAISETQVTAAATAILGARKVWVIGFRASHSFATYLQWQMTQVIENISAIPGGGQTLGEHLVSIDHDDVVILFGLRRRVSLMEPILAQLEKSGARLLYITDEGVPFLNQAEWHFRCQTLAPGPLFNHVSVMALCHLLTTRCIEIAGTAGRNRLRGIEAINDALEEL